MVVGVVGSRGWDRCGAFWRVEWLFDTWSFYVRFMGYRIRGLEFRSGLSVGANGG